MRSKGWLGCSEVIDDVNGLWQLLELESDELVVLSAAYATDGESVVLVAASLLGGPSDMADGWPSWRRAHGFKPTPSQDSLTVPGEFQVETEDGVAGRVVMDPDDALAWLRAALLDGLCPAVGNLPEAVISLDPATAPIRVCTHSETEAGQLATWLARPITGFYFPATANSTTLGEVGHWEVDGKTHFSPGLDLLGMSWLSESKNAPPSGLLVGRFERRAWLATQELDRNDDLYKVEIGIEPSRAELIDLEIEVEEYVGDELVFGEHLRLEDTDLGAAQKALYEPSPAQSGRLEVGVKLPTLGRHVRRSVRLTHRDGELLDEWLSFHIVESISITPTFDGAVQPTITVGERRGRMDLVALLGAVQRIKSQYANMRRGGVANRVFETYGDGRKALQAILRRAPGELLVVDPFFDDWPLLTELGKGMRRVLIGPNSPAPPNNFKGKARRATGKLAPFHDRFYLWEGGGLFVGTSAGTKTDRLFRIAKIGAPEAKELGGQFSLWWSDPTFVPA